MRRLPYTLWLYILGDLWKLVLLTTGVLVTVIAFAAAVKPLADGKLGPEDTLKFMLLAMIPMLQYALPFASCFGATLAYHRLAADNEMTAAYAGGISHRAFLVPAWLSGIALALILLGLSNYIIPRQLRSMSELVAQDAAKWIVSSIERGEALRMDNNTMLYADVVERKGPDEHSGAYERLWLGGVLMVRGDEKGEIESYGTAKSAMVWLRRTTMAQPGVVGSVKPMTEVVVRPTDFEGFGPGYRGAGEQALRSFFVPNAFSDNVKYLSFSELRSIREEPARIDRVDKEKRAVAMAVAQRNAIDAIDEALRSPAHAAEFVDPLGPIVTLRAGGLRATRRERRPDPDHPEEKPARKWERDPYVFAAVPLPGHKSIEVDVSQDKRRPPLGAEAVYLRFPSTLDADGDQVTLTLDLRKFAAETIGRDGEVDAPDEAPEARGEVSERPLTDLRFTGYDPRPMLNESTMDTERAAREKIAIKPANEAVIAEPLGHLAAEVKDLLNEVLSKEQERFAMSVACLVMVLVGAVMAMRLREALPLTVYLWAFFPALATVLAVSGGQQVTHSHGTVGLPVLWAGVAALGAFALVEFVRLRKH